MHIIESHHPDLSLPVYLVDAIKRLWGEESAKIWLDEIPDRLAALSSKWDVELYKIAEGGAMSVCAFGVNKMKMPIVVKIPSDVDSGVREFRVLEYWSSTGVTPNVLINDRDTGSFMMERIFPGETVFPSNMEDSLLFSKLLSKLSAPGFGEYPLVPDIEELVAVRFRFAEERYAHENYRLLRHHLSAALEVLTVLLRTSKDHPSYLLHGDLQPKNILRGESSLVAIDPLGARGDINADAALWVAIQNGPMSIGERLESLENHPLLDEIRLYAWSYVFAVIENRKNHPLPSRRMESHLETVDLQILMKSIR